MDLTSTYIDLIYLVQFFDKGSSDESLPILIKVKNEFS